MKLAAQRGDHLFLTSFNRGRGRPQSPGSATEYLGAVVRSMHCLSFIFPCISPSINSFCVFVSVNVFLRSLQRIVD